MDDLAIVFIYTQKDIITTINLNSIKKNNPNIPIFEVNYKDYTDTIDFIKDRPISNWSASELWYSCDSIFLYWYLFTEYKAKNYLLVEWDTYCNNISFTDFLGDSLYNNTGLTASKIININTNPNDVWFTDSKNKQLLHNIFHNDNIYKFSPMSCSVISDNLVKDIILFLKNNTLASKIYVETKFASIAKHLKYDVKEYPQKLYEHITYHENTCENLIKKKLDNLTGIFHPIKKLSIFRKYFANQILSDSKINHSIKIHSAIYGAYHDISNDITLLINNNINNIKINNNISGDPAPHKNKRLYLKYEKNGQIFEKVVNEGENIDLSNL